MMRREERKWKDIIVNLEIRDNGLYGIEIERSRRTWVKTGLRIL